VVEEGGGEEARAGGHLGHRLLGCGQLEAAAAAAVDDRQLGEFADRGDDRASPLSQLGGGAALHEADRAAAHAAPGRAVADAGDLALVSHQRRQLQLWPALDLARQGDGLLDGVTGERFGPILTRPPSAHQPASTSMQTLTGAAPAPSTDSIASRCSGAVTITDRAPPGWRPSAAPARPGPSVSRSG
jgi:hypothetical protein